MQKNSVFAIVCFLFLIPVLIGILFFAFAPAAQADDVARLKITTPPQTVLANVTSTVMIVEAQDAAGATSTATATIYINLSSSSASGKFTSAQIGGSCTSLLASNKIFISTGNYRKSFCYIDETPGTHTLTVEPEQSGITPDSQTITVTAAQTSTTTPETTSTTTPDSAGNLQSATSTPDSASSTPENLSQSFKVKIVRFVPNPLGDDAGQEWMEIKNEDEKDVLLDGWLLDDKNTGEGPAGDALVLSGVIAVGETKRFVLPPGSFALNNSGGDEINLYFSDKSLADRVVYTQTAYDDGVFEFREGSWQQPARASSGSGGGGGSAAATDLTNSSLTTAFRFNEILPNPLGDDAGKEWVEIFNPNTVTTTLEGYFLANGDSDSWSALAWAIPKGELIPPLGLAVINLSKDALTLKNAGREKVKLFSPQKQLQDFVVYENAPENKAWAKNKAGQWEWNIPTFGEPNDRTPDLAKVFISEILPWPASDDEEFVELFNFATTTINLEGAVLRIGSRGKTFEAGANIGPNGYLAIYEDDLPVRLRNTGQTVKLFDAFGRLVAETTYGKAQAGLSFASSDGKNYLWTSLDTPGAVNEFVLGEAIDASPKQPDSGSKASGSTAATAMTRAQAKEILATNRQLEARLAVLQDSVNQLANDRDGQNQASRPVPVGQGEPSNRAPNFGGLSLIMGALVIVAGALGYFFRSLKT